MMRRSSLQQRTPMKPSAKPMRRSPMSQRAPMKSSSRRKHKIDGHHDAKMLEACRDEACFLSVPGVCLGEGGRATVVPCHSNDGAHGKGMGLKAADRFSVPGCAACHHYLDQGPAPKHIKRAIFEAAFARWEPMRAAKLNKERK